MSPRLLRTLRNIFRPVDKTTHKKSWPLPRELSEAPDWLLDDVGIAPGPNHNSERAACQMWRFLVRRLG